MYKRKKHCYIYLHFMMSNELDIGGKISRSKSTISIYQTQGNINTSSIFQRETKISKHETLTEHAHKKPI